MTNLETRAALLALLTSERAALLALLPRFDAQQWHTTTRADGWSVHDIVAHLADAHYGLALLVLGEATPPVPLNPATGWMDVDGYNQQRRTKNAQLTREKVTGRLSSAFDQVQRAIKATDDYDAPSVIGSYTQGQVLDRIMQHSRAHQHELAEMLSTEVEETRRRGGEMDGQ